MKRHTEHVLVLVAVAVVVAIGVGVFAWSGLYNIGADDHHYKPTLKFLTMVRDRSIHVRSKDIKVPNLDDPQLILKGAGQYAAMCTGCHLRPGQENSELREGMYPQPPNLSKVHVDPQDAFWVIKHGIKMSAMPAWGLDGSHDDLTIWSMVAFIEKLPGMTPEQYKAIVAKAPPDEDMDMDDGDGHSHSHGGAADEGARSAADMKGMEMSGEAGHSHGAVAEDGHDHAAATAPAAEAPLSLDGMKPKAIPEAEAVAQAFQTALQHGDRTAALALLAPEATISEGGHTQTRDDYANGHLGEDIAFLKSAKVTPISFGSMPMGDTAMVGSESDIQATVKGKSTTLRSRELLTLKKAGKDWKIVSIQWQSAPVSGE